MLKKILSSLLAIALCAAILPPAQAAGTSWKYDKGVLILGGTGTADYSNRFSWQINFGSKITELQIGPGVTGVAGDAFKELTALKSVTLPDTFKVLSGYGFRGCTALAQVDLGKGLEKLDSGAFKGCTALKSITVPGGVDRPGDNAFEGCTSLVSARLEEGCGWVSKMMFHGCISLRSVELPSDLIFIGDDAFKDCWALTDIYYNGTRAQWENVRKDDTGVELAAATIHCLDAVLPGTPKPPQSGTQSILFDDVLSNYWGYNPIMTCARNGLVMGIRQPDANGVGSFGPEQAVTLGQMLVVITTLVCPEKRQNIPSHWAKGSYAAALETGIIQQGDFPDTIAALDTPLNRQDMAYIAANAARYKGWKLAERPEVAQEIRDFHVVSADRQQAVIQCYSSGILAGYGDKRFGPKDTMTRAQMTVVVCRLAGW
ncbi:MAG: leucine-rich repeat protein [Oscillospiraceae bacterium]|nr:leucine-rich repeat protein [Oscillospiraceae bacterium]